MKKFLYIVLESRQGYQPIIVSEPPHRSRGFHSSMDFTVPRLGNPKGEEEELRSSSFYELLSNSKFIKLKN